MNRSGPRSPLITDPAALASIIPFYLGYRPEPTTVTITTINGMRVAETRLLPYTPRVDHDLLSKQLLQIPRRPDTSLAIFGWSHDFRRFAHSVHVAAYTLGIPDFAGIVDGDEVQMQHADNPYLWGEREPLLDMTYVMGTLGYRPPAADRAALLTATRPYGDLSRDNAVDVDEMAPGRRVWLACEALELLSTINVDGDPLHDVDTAHKERLLAYLSSAVVRDTVALRLWQGGNPEQRRAFIDLWQECGEQDAAWLAPIAALTEYGLTGQHWTAAEISALASETDPLTPGVHQVLQSRIPPADLAQELSYLHSVDDLWRASNLLDLERETKAPTSLATYADVDGYDQSPYLSTPQGGRSIDL